VQSNLFVQKTIEEPNLKKIVRSRVTSHINAAMKYFWASLVFQIIVYSLSSHVIVSYWPDKETVLMGLGVILLYIPFTVMLMKKFKQMAGTKMDGQPDKGSSLYQFTTMQTELLQSFYNFKKTYEFVLIPLSTIIGILITFKLYVPGGVSAHPQGAGITFIITLASCIAAIISENRKSFEQPIRQLKHILDEFQNEA
jgi:hypothetical protein